MSHQRKLAVTSSFYFISTFLAAFAGAITLPVWTRLLSLQQYGLLSLASATLSFMVIFCKFGVQHATLRFYSDIKAGKMPHGLASYYSTMSMAGIVFSLTVTSLAVVVARLLLKGGDNLELIALVVPVGAAIVLQANNNNNLSIFLRAEQKAKLHSAVVVSMRYGRFGMALLMVFLLGATVRNVFYGWVLSGAVVCCFLLVRMVSLGQISFRAFSPDLLRQAVAYGFPMVWTEVAKVALSVGDRFVLQYYWGEATVGLYSVGYNLSNLGQSMLSVPMRMAVIPLYLSIWATRGKEETRIFVGQALRYYLMLGTPLALGVIWFRTEIVTLLATTKFIEAQTVVPVIVVPLLLHGAFAVYGAGLYISKKTVVFMTVTLAATAVNVGLNLILVPKMGMRGAAWATAIAYLFIAALIFFKARPHLKVPFNWPAAARYLALTLLVLAAASMLPEGWNVVIKIACVAVAYLGLVFAFDRDCRADLKGMLRR